ncbi:MAG TPA: 50S ribosomal protein L22 [Bacilli bacterium]|jgi:large subunit ribosomal protein L22|nr:50S ribosomal protein L22 [Bacilli bacterium]HOC80395.1 50S ribosomal protein L22 [Bacilli bacterium]
MAEKKPVTRKKAVKPAKVEEKPAAPAKPKVTEARAVAYDVRLTPRKARMVIDLVRGKDLNVALGILANVNRSASPAVAKVIKSAAANAINNFAMEESKLYVHTIYANDGLRMKRYMPRAKGSSSGIIKRTCHIYVTIKSR